MARKKKDPFSIQTTILQALLEGPSYGYGLVKRVKERTNGKIVIGQGSLYPALSGLEREGLLTSYFGEELPERGNRPRKYYRLTAEGLRRAREDHEVATQLFGLPQGVPA